MNGTYREDYGTCDVCDGPYLFDGPPHCGEHGNHAGCCPCGQTLTEDTPDVCDECFSTAPVGRWHTYN